MLLSVFSLSAWLPALVAQPDFFAPGNQVVCLKSKLLPAGAIDQQSRSPNQNYIGNIY